MCGKLAYIGLGTNLGDRLGSLQHAVGLIAAAGSASAARISQVYESPPWGYISSNSFLNAVMELHWDGAPEELRLECARIEAKLGRIHQQASAILDGSQRYCDRLIDLDVLWFEGVTTMAADLTLPHPRAHQRAFVLLPWLELAPELELSGRTLSAWLADLESAEVAATQANPGLQLIVPGSS